IRLDPEPEVDTSICRSKTGSDLIEDQHGSNVISDPTDLFEVTGKRGYSPLWFHNDRGQLILMRRHDTAKLVNPIVVKGNRGAFQSLWDPGRIKTGHQLAGQGIFVTEIGGKVRVSPAMIAGKRNDIPPGEGSSNPDRH